MAECSKGWLNRCTNAKHPDCVCKCGGENHGCKLPGGADNKMLPLTDSRIFSIQTEFRINLNWENDIVLQRDLGEDVHTNVVRRYVVHSPGGFEWGYGGSSPADLALNILGMFIPAYWAWRFHQDFKFTFVGKIPKEGGIIPAVDIILWIQEQKTYEDLSKGYSAL